MLEKSNEELFKDSRAVLVRILDGIMWGYYKPLEPCEELNALRKKHAKLVFEVKKRGLLKC
jgi:hypothetical protein